MASRIKWMFFILTTLITTFVVFLAMKEITIFSAHEHSRYSSFQQNATYQGSTSTVIVTSSYPETDITDQGYNESTEVSNLKGKSDLQKQSYVHRTIEGTHTNDSTRWETFQSIDNKQAWMYSAFFDHMAEQQGKPLVRLIGLVKHNCMLEINCNLSTENKSFMSTGKIKFIGDPRANTYTPSYAECNLPLNVRPTHVSISFQSTQEPTNRFQIIYPGPRIRNFTVCYSVLHNKYNWSSQLIQSIEMNRILGADHFFVYNYSISPNTDQILRRYQQDGLVTVLQWRLPTLNIHYFAQMTALNDCFHRNRNTSRFALVVDTDEYIIPNHHANWMELIQSVSPQEQDISLFMKSSQPSKKTSLTSCFLLKSSFFSAYKIPDWNILPSEFSFTEEEKTNIMKYKLLTLSQLWRRKIIYRPRVRSKFMARPELVYITGIHFVHKFIYFMKCRNVSDYSALLHHYKVFKMTSDTVLDTSILKFKSKLYPCLMEQFKKFPNIFT